MFEPASRHRVWDLPVRLFHWLLVVLVTLLWISGDFGGFDVTLTLPLKGTVFLSNMDVHALFGQALLVLLVFRLLWGVVGSSTARFGHFLRRPTAVFAEIRHLARGRVPAAVGHNPLGALMVVALLALLSAQGITGLFAQDDLFFEAPLAHHVSDDLSNTLTDLHHRFFTVLQVLIVVHIVAILYYLVRGENLVTPMVTGKKRLAESPGVTFGSPWRALACLAVAVATVVGVVNL